MKLPCFKAYDIRGQLSSELNEDLAYRIGFAYAHYLNAKTVAVGCDIRLSSEPLKHALMQGLVDAGSDVIDLGMTGTEEVYFAAFHLDVDGGIEVTASHNPIDYNGMKLVRKNAAPMSAATGLNAIEALVIKNQFQPVAQKGVIKKLSILDAYIDHLLGYMSLDKLRPFKLVVNAGNGAAGHVIDALEARFKSFQVPVTLIKMHHEADGTFPNGIPNPLLPENRSQTAAMVKMHQADMGIAWDGDFDRCFLFDDQGEYIESYYLVGLLAEIFLQQAPGEKIIHDPRLIWNTRDIVHQAGGEAIQSKTGHSFIKECMRAENAIYGGEMSGHHYFRDFSYCDSGMIPWLMILELLSTTQKSLSQCIQERINAFPCSGEINYKVTHADRVLHAVQQHYAPLDPIVDDTDGLGLEFEQFRLNLRSSNTEPLLRLNVESRQNREYITKTVKQIEHIINSVAAETS